MRAHGARIAAMVLFAAWLVVSPAGAEEKSRKPRVYILATGGTIAAAPSKDPDLKYKAGAVAVDALLAAIPQVKTVADIRGEQVVNIASQDMTDAIWLKLARRVNELLSTGVADGVVITHGTDTLEETAFFLDRVVSSPRPVVLTGAMRPANALGADGPANLVGAVTVAADSSSRGRGVMVVFNDEIHAGWQVVKTHTSRPDAFSSIPMGPIGSVFDGKVRFFSAARARPGGGGVALGEAKALPRVDILYAYAGTSPDLVDAAVAAGAKGIVLAGVGVGNANQKTLAALHRAVADGVVVVRSSRVPTGPCNRNVEINDDQLGFVAARGLNPQQSRVLLQLALLRTRDAAMIQRMYDSY